MQKNYKKVISILCMILFMFGSMYSFVALRDMQGETWCITNQITHTFSVEAGIFGILTVILLWNFLKVQDKRLKGMALIFGCITSVLYTFGHMLQYQNNIGDTAGEWWRAIGIAIALIPIPMSLFALIIDYATKHSVTAKVRTFLFDTTIEKERSVRTIVLFYWLILFISFIPVFLAYYPGLPVYDAQYQFKQIHDGFMTTHHPVIHMLLIKGAYQIGNAIGSINKGIALLSLFQMAVLSFSFAYAIGFLRYIKASRKARIIVAVLIVLFPVNAVYSISITKDVFFAACFLMFVIELLYFYHLPKYSISRCTFFVFATVMMLMFRNNALYALAISIPLLLIFMKGKRKKLLVLCLLAIVIFFVSDRGLKNAEDAFDNSSTKETFALPIQQVARVYTYKADSREALSEVTAYIPEGMLTAYNPYLADSVKTGMDNDLFKENLGDFLKIWFSTGIKYPGEYLEAFLTNNMGFWYLDDTMHARIYGEGGYMVVQYKEENMLNMVSANCFCKVAKDYYDALFFKNGYQKIPLVSILFRPAFFFYAYLVMALLMIYRKAYIKLLPLVLVLGYFLTLLLAPAALVRYMYCLMCVLPVAMVWSLRSQEQ